MLFRSVTDVRIHAALDAVARERFVPTAKRALAYADVPVEIAPGQILLNAPNFPAAYKPEATAGTEFLDALRNVKDLDWTFLSPSAFFGPGERTGQFRRSDNTLLTAADGKSSISYEDYAIAMLDEIEKPQHIRGRFTVGY